LRSAAAFAGPAGDQLRFVASFRDRQRHYDARQLVVAEGHADAPLMTIFSGWAFRFRTLSDGRRQILNFLMPGDFIGLQQELDAALTHGVEALTPMTACIFDRKRLWELYREHPALAYDLTWLCAHEELIVDENLLSVGQRSAQERIAMLLIHLYKRGAGLGLCEEGTLTLPLGPPTRRCSACAQPAWWPWRATGCASAGSTTCSDSPTTTRCPSGPAR